MHPNLLIRSACFQTQLDHLGLFEPRTEIDVLIALGGYRSRVCLGPGIHGSIPGPSLCRWSRSTEVSISNNKSIPSAVDEIVYIMFISILVHCRRLNTDPSAEPRLYIEMLCYWLVMDLESWSYEHVVVCGTLNLNVLVCFALHPQSQERSRDLRCALPKFKVLHTKLFPGRCAAKAVPYRHRLSPQWDLITLCAEMPVGGWQEQGKKERRKDCQHTEMAPVPGTSPASAVHEFMPFGGHKKQF